MHIHRAVEIFKDEKYGDIYAEIMKYINTNYIKTYDDNVFFSPKMDLDGLKKMVEDSISIAREKKIKITIRGFRNHVWIFHIETDGFKKTIINVFPDFSRFKSYTKIASIQFLIHKLIFYNVFELDRKDIDLYMDLVNAYSKKCPKSKKNVVVNKKRKWIYIKTDGGRNEYIGGYINPKEGVRSSVYARGYYITTKTKRIYSNTNYCWPVDSNGNAHILVVIKFHLLDLMWGEAYSKPLEKILSQLPRSDIFGILCKGKNVDWKERYRLKYDKTWDYIKHSSDE